MSATDDELRVAGRARMDAARQTSLAANAEKIELDGMGAGEHHADAAWKAAMLLEIRALPAGATFLVEEVVATLRERGVTTHDARAAGAMAQKAKNLGLIAKAGYRGAETSNGAPKVLWMKRP